MIPKNDADALKKLSGEDSIKIVSKLPYRFIFSESMDGNWNLIKLMIV
ncbi:MULTISPECIES: hypothetical protein [Chryseobacterium]|nr:MULTISPECIES: hypothetical protein [Chryseobacterium]MBT2623447.1 hypothetical protein [Chryseobacterium sp. ISL-6]